MVKDCKVVWANCLGLIKDNVNEQSFKTWFQPIIPVKLEKKVLTILVPNKFFYEMLESNYIMILKEAIVDTIGAGARLEYQFKIQNHRSVQEAQNKVDDQSFAAQDIKNPFVIPGIKKVRFNPQLNKNYTFENFIEGDCNRLARSAGIAIANNPGGTAFNPLVIYGDVGLGKTHLTHAIGNEVLKRKPETSVLYVSVEKFTNQLIQSIQNGAVSDFVNFYQLVDVLIIDDIQFLKDRTKTQEIFFNIFNHLHQSSKQIILTSDCPPKDMEGMEDRLISRFKWGLVADLQAPDYETRVAILQAKMNKEGIVIPSDVKEFICYNVKNNIRELEGVLIQLIAQASLNQKKIDLDLATKVVQNFVKHSNKEVTIDSIKRLVAEHFKLDPDKLGGKTRKRPIVIARHLSMYLAKNLTNNSLKAIGSNFGGRDHSTVIHACKAVEDLMDTDIVFKDTVSSLQKKVQLSLNV
jgi:chromosomal replication initiator protein